MDCAGAAVVEVDADFGVEAEKAVGGNNEPGLELWTVGDRVPAVELHACHT